jgi:hypothetical protein
MLVLKASAWSVLILVAGALAGSLAAAEPAPAAASPADGLKPGEWFEVPGSKLNASGVFPPKPTPPGNGPGSVMGAWCGAALDTKRNRLVINGGGHGDYAGNEIYIFDLIGLKWTRPWGPVPEAGPYPGEKDAYAEGVPTSVHTYDGLIYLPKQDLLWRGGGSKWGGSGGGTQACWTFDFEKLAWQRKANSNCGSLGVSVCAEYDPVTGHIFSTGDHYGFGEYDPDKDTWTARGSMALGEEPTMTIDPEARVLLLTGNGQFSVCDLKTGKVSKPKPQGDQTVVKCRGPGLVYDGKLKRIVGWGGGASLYSLDVATWTWTEHKPAATNKVTPAGKPARLLAFSKFQYWPAKNAYVVVNSVSDSVYFGRIGPASPAEPAQK